MLTLAEAAVLLGRSPATLRNQVKNGHLHARLLGKTWTVTEREVERYRHESLGRPGRRRVPPPEGKPTSTLTSAKAGR